MIYQSIKTRGFVALISVIIISIVLLGLVSASNTAGFFVRFNASNAEFKRQAFALAESCANTALLSLAQNYTYTPSQSIQVSFGSDSCSIDSIADVGAPSPNSRSVRITASAHYMQAFSTLQLDAIITNPAAPSGNLPQAVTITSWREVQ